MLTIQQVSAGFLIRLVLVSGKFPFLSTLVVFRLIQELNLSLLGN